MAICKQCEEKIRWLEGGEDGLCPECRKQKIAATNDKLPASADRTEQDEEEQRISRLAQCMLVTTETASDLHIDERLDVVTAECVFGLNLFKDIFSSARDVFGGRSVTTQNSLRDARKYAMAELRKEAAMIGAHAVVGVDLDYSEFSGGGKSMLLLVASGTAVTLK